MGGDCAARDSFDWKPAEMVFISSERGLAPIRFVPGLPAPLNGLAGVAASRLMTTKKFLPRRRVYAPGVYGIDRGCHTQRQASGRADRALGDTSGII
jgi:hypothetical protein